MNPPAVQTPSAPATSVVPAHPFSLHGPGSAPQTLVQEQYWNSPDVHSPWKPGTLRPLHRLSLQRGVPSPQLTGFLWAACGNEKASGMLEMVTRRRMNGRIMLNKVNFLKDWYGSLV